MHYLLINNLAIMLTVRDRYWSSYTIAEHGGKWVCIREQEVEALAFFFKVCIEYYLLRLAIELFLIKKTKRNIARH